MLLIVLAAAFGLVAVVAATVLITLSAANDHRQTQVDIKIASPPPLPQQAKLEDPKISPPTLPPQSPASPPQTASKEVPAVAPLSLPPPAVVPVQAFPDIETFKSFADALAKEMKNQRIRESNEIQKSQTTQHDYSEEISVVSCDYKKTDSLLRPMVAVVVLRAISFRNNKELLVYLWTEDRYTVQFAFEKGKWVPVKAFYVLEKYESMPKSSVSKDPPTGQEEEINVKWFRELSAAVQTTTQSKPQE